MGVVGEKKVNMKDLFEFMVAAEKRREREAAALIEKLRAFGVSLSTIANMYKQSTTASLPAVDIDLPVKLHDKGTVALAGAESDSSAIQVGEASLSMEVAMPGSSRSIPSTRLEIAIDITGLATPTPTKCLMECPSHDASVCAAALLPSATTKSSTSTGGVVPELVVPMVSDNALDVDVTGDTSPMAAICSTGDCDDFTGNEGSAAMSLTPGSAPASFVAPRVFEAMVSHGWLISVEDICVLMPKFNSPPGCCFTTVQSNDMHSDCMLRPWPSFKCSSFWTLLVRQVVSEQREGFCSVVALNIRAMLLHQLRVISVHHVREKHNKILWGLQQRQQPSPPPELEIECCMKEAASDWTHMFEIAGRTVLHQLGNLVSSHSLFADNATSTPCVQCFLDEVLWKLPKSWPSFMVVPVHGDQTRPLPWPSFEEVNDVVSTEITLGYPPLMSVLSSLMAGAHDNSRPSIMVVYFPASAPGASMILQVAVSRDDGNAAAYLNLRAVCVELEDKNGRSSYLAADSCEDGTYWLVLSSSAGLMYCSDSRLFQFV